MNKTYIIIAKDYNSSKGYLSEIEKVCKGRSCYDSYSRTINAVTLKVTGCTFIAMSVGNINHLRGYKVDHIICINEQWIGIECLEEIRHMFPHTKFTYVED